MKTALLGILSFAAGLCMVASVHASPLDDIPAAERDRLGKLVGGDVSVATNEVERFCALNRAAKNAMTEGKTNDAKAYALELVKLAPKYTNDWNYGNAIQDANQVLGRIALSEGNIAEAKERLLASADSKGSPQMNSFGPNMQLAKELLEKGEKEVVLQYFARCLTFWKMGTAQIKEWTESVNNGAIPNFGANLQY